MNCFTPTFIVPQFDVLHTKDGRDYDTNNYERNKTSIRKIKKNMYTYYIGKTIIYVHTYKPHTRHQLIVLHTYAKGNCKAAQTTASKR